MEENNTKEQYASVSIDEIEEWWNSAQYDFRNAYDYKDDDVREYSRGQIDLLQKLFPKQIKMIIGDLDDDEENPTTVSNIDKMCQYKDGDIVVTEDNRHKWISIFKSFDFVNGVTTVYATILLEPTPNGLYFNDRFIIYPCRLATDIEKQTFINELKKDNRNEAKECLEKFFNIKNNEKMIPYVIHKDNQELRNKLESFGYCPHPTMINVDEDNNWLMCNRDFYSAIPLGNKDELQKIVDCGDNEEYFLAMAELNSNNKKSITIKKEIINMLKVFGYEPKVSERMVSGGIQTDIYFHVDNGFDTMPVRHKDAILMLAKGYLSEFYYGGDIQHIYLYKKCHGLEPDDNRYSCLLHEIKLVNSITSKGNSGSEIFVNMGDHFSRYVDWIKKSEY